MPAIVLANLCVAYIMTSQNEEAEELMRRVEREEERGDPDKQVRNWRAAVCTCTHTYAHTHTCGESSGRRRGATPTSRCATGGQLYAHAHTHMHTHTHMRRVECEEERGDPDTQVAALPAH